MARADQAVRRADAVQESRNEWIASQQQMIAVIDGAIEHRIVERPAPPARVPRRFMDDHTQPHGPRLPPAQAQPRHAGTDYMDRARHFQPIPWRRKIHAFSNGDSATA